MKWIEDTYKVNSMLKEDILKAIFRRHYYQGGAALLEVSVKGNLAY
jgi:hypothetical protein